MRTNADAIVEELRELYNEVVQDEHDYDLNAGTILGVLTDALQLFDELDNRLLTGQPLPLEWRR